MFQSPITASDQDHADHDRGEPSVYEKREAERELESIRHRHYALTAVCVLLAAVIGVAIWYEYPVLIAHKADLQKLPALLHNIDGITDHLRDTDAQMGAWSRQRDMDREAVETEMTKVTRDVRAGMAATRKQISDATDAAYTRIQTRVSEQIDRIETRLGSLETKRDADQKQIAALGEELARVRQDLSQQTDRVATLEQQVEQNRASTASQIGSLRGEQDQGRQKVDAIETQLAVDKVPFEAPRGQDHELAGGISLHVTRTDASHGRFDGWVALQSGQSSIELRHRGIQEPLIFYGQEDGKRRELVITTVDRNSVAGYLLVPKDVGKAAVSGQ